MRKCETFCTLYCLDNNQRDESARFHTLWRISADSVSRSPGYILRSRLPRTSRGKFLRLPRGSPSPPSPSQYVTRLMELAKDPFPVDRVCRWRRLTSFPSTRTKRELLVILAPAISLRTLVVLYVSSSRPAVATANIRELYPSIAFVISKTRASITLVPELSNLEIRARSPRELARELSGLQILHRRAMSREIEFLNCLLKSRTHMFDRSR